MALSPFKSPQGTTARSGNERRRILYVEDDDVIWEVAEFALRKDYEITRARNARETFDLLSRNKYDLILMDIQLAGSDLDGIAITRLLKGRYDGTTPQYAVGVSSHGAPIIFVTAYTSLYKKDDLERAGGDERISKPVDFTRLSLAMTRLLVRDL
ncbi:MAG: response regulator [Myxococcota bacterium]